MEDCYVQHSLDRPGSLVWGLCCRSAGFLEYWGLDKWGLDEQRDFVHSCYNSEFVSVDSLMPHYA